MRAFSIEERKKYCMDCQILFGSQTISLFCVVFHFLRLEFKRKSESTIGYKVHKKLQLLLQSNVSSKERIGAEE